MLVKLPCVKSGHVASPVRGQQVDSSGTACFSKVATVASSFLLLPWG